MLNKVAGLARALGLILAVVAGFVAVPAPVALILAVLGLVAGLAYTSDDFIRLALAGIVMPLVGTALANLPTIGAGLAAAATNCALLIAGALATRLIIRIYELVLGDVKALAS